MTDPTCPTCGHPANWHCDTETCDCPRHKVCPNIEGDVLRVGIASAQEEVARLRTMLDAQIANSEALNLVARQREAERDALAKDGARLDWLEQFTEMQVGDSNAPAPLFWWLKDRHGTLREAIDAALSTTTEGENDG